METGILEPQQFWNDEFLSTEYDISRCSYKLFDSSIFGAHADYVRRQIIYCLLQEDDLKTLHFIASFLLFDGRQNEAALQMMNEEGVFGRLLELIQTLRNLETEGDAGLHRLLMDLLYEMSRIQRIRIEDLVLVDDDFVRCLFDIIEDLSYDVTDPYHYPVIRVLLVLNEQFMISAHNPADERFSSGKLTNKVIKVLSAYVLHASIVSIPYSHGDASSHENTAETSLQLLTLKLLYLIFTTPSTYEYFFTNDLHVLVDILIRNLLDLPEEASALRHTYLRVLYPLLAHTQLRLPPHYKRNELRNLLRILGRGQITYGTETEQEKILHFEEVDETTRRLVARCATVDWLCSPDSPSTATPVLETSAQAQAPAKIATVLEDASQQDSPVEIEPADVSTPLSRTSTSPDTADMVPPTRVDSLESRDSSSAFESRRGSSASAMRRLGMHLEPASASTLSVQAVAAQHEKPGVITPSRTGGKEDVHLPPEVPVLRLPKVKPAPPKSRRSRGRRLVVDEEEQPSTSASSIDRNNNTGSDDMSPTSVHESPTKSLLQAAATASAHATVNPSPNTSERTPDQGQTSIGLGAAAAAAAANKATPVTPTTARRSASHPPPAVPPPRRSAHTTPSTSHHRSSIASASTFCPSTDLILHTHPTPTTMTTTTSTPTPTTANKHGQKPAPPKARRWGRSKPQTHPHSHSHTDSMESGISTGSQAKESDAEAVAFAQTQEPAGPEEGSVSDPFSPTSPTGPDPHFNPTLVASPDNMKGSVGPVSVEEAVQNVSLH
ncbi:hypothetical protein N7539_006328 [Penicillium diatomitis]|uniref:SPIN90/Ldb17 leucine-rich domain-containing protein n=1 Tax=Penicillium diatomitis TaxID=2819901 RepID=A0A9W9X2W9_9EURO|nr:uncharacterized protein N7539_006328 [Penicillium diatomitis]KAJ5482882.1 hypothetical protein N7539_006328 [Penicillium diatomitis]